VRAQKPGLALSVGLFAMAALIAGANCKGLEPRVSLWATDPRTQVLDLRRALDDVIACEPRPDWESFGSPWYSCAKVVPVDE